MREDTVCFTGHRPEKLPGLESGGETALKMLRSMLYFQIYEAVRDGYKNFYTGLARGVDLWAAEYVLDIKNKHPEIKLYGVKPYPNHGSNFKGEDLWILSNVLEKAESVICSSPAYSRDCYKIRNYYMVDRSSRIIAMVDDYHSGTGQTISYAKTQGLDLKIIKVPEIKELSESRSNLYEIKLD